MHSDFTTFMSKSFQILRPILSITFPQGFRKSKKFGLQEVGVKRRLNGVNK